MSKFGRMTLPPEVYVNENEPLYGCLVSDGSREEAEKAVLAECASGLPLHFLGIRVAPLLNDDGRPGRRRRFYVFTDEPRRQDDPVKEEK